MAAITLRIITPDRVLLDTEASSVTFPTVDGSVGVLKDHAPMVAAVGVGELGYSNGSGSREALFVSGGFAEVRDNVLRVVTDVSEPISEIDVDRAVRAAERARERLRAHEHPEGDPVDLWRAQAAMQRALMRQKLVEKYR